MPSQVLTRHVLERGGQIAYSGRYDGRTSVFTTDAQKANAVLREEGSTLILAGVERLPAVAE